MRRHFAYVLNLCIVQDMKVRPPEELLAWMNHSFPPLHFSKVDSYLLGNVMYYALTNQWLFEEHDTTQQSVNAILDGKRSEFPPAIIDISNPAIQTMRKAIEQLWIQDPDERHTAREVSDFLMEELRRDIGAGEDIEKVRVIVPPLPPGWRHTESDFLHHARPSSSDEDDGDTHSDELEE